MTTPFSHDLELLFQIQNPINTPLKIKTHIDNNRMVNSNL